MDEKIFFCYWVVQIIMWLTLGPIKSNFQFTFSLKFSTHGFIRIFHFLYHQSLWPSASSLQLNLRIPLAISLFVKAKFKSPMSMTRKRPMFISHWDRLKILMLMMKFQSYSYLQDINLPRAQTAAVWFGRWRWLGQLALHPPQLAFHLAAATHLAHVATLEVVDVRV